MSPKKILFLTSKFMVGGVECALINLVKNIDKSKYNITLIATFPSDNIGENKIDGIRILQLDEYKSECFNQQGKSKSFYAILKSIYARFMTHIFHDYCRSAYWAIKSWSDFEEEYDCVISYKADDAVVASLASKFKAKKKILWVHGELPETSSYKKCYQRIANGFDGIFCVSDAIEMYVKKYFKEYKGVVLSIGNIVDSEDIVNKGQEHIDVQFKNNSIVTVGRLSPEKGQAMIPLTTRLLLDAGYDVYWYLVGDGDLRETVESEIQKYDVAEHVILLGTQMNPYPYIKNCDIYVQTSFSEGWCLTVQEARILQKPIVTTPLPVMHEQIISGENGLIAETVTPEALFEGIRTLLDHPELREKFVENLSHEVCDNSGELQKLYDFIES